MTYLVIFTLTFFEGISAVKSGDLDCVVKEGVVTTSNNLPQRKNVTVLRISIVELNISMKIPLYPVLGLFSCSSLVHVDVLQHGGRPSLAEC
jgi:hypothetical protein